MEWWTEARALKPSRRGEATVVKPGQSQSSVVSDELLSLNRVPSAEDFSVECFLDLSEDLLVHGGDGEEGQEVGSLCSSQEEQAEEADNSSASEPFLLDQLPLPVKIIGSWLLIVSVSWWVLCMVSDRIRFLGQAEDVAELEWVSRVVDDCSSPEVSLLFTERKAEEAEHIWVPPSRAPCFSFRVPVKPRTRRSRNGTTTHLVWPFLSPSSGPIHRPHQRRKKQEEPPGTTMFQRRCSHCGANDTPQWRTGPLGPKTLCNACGVRYKSGRLCPEYRPACSPSFSSEIHSNVHRKVLELRKVKEPGEANQTESNSVGRETR